jgi:hypothetical protein
VKHLILAALVSLGAVVGTFTADGSRAAGALARPAAAHAGGCQPLTARITSDPTAVIDYSSAQPEGGQLSGATIRRPGHFYEFMNAVEFRIKGNIVAASKGTILKLSCYRRTRTGRDFPGVNLLRGSLEITSARTNPVGIVSEEGLFDPRLAPTLTNRAEVTTAQKIKWFANFGDQPMGTTIATSSGIVGVTPTVGPRRGSCRYIHFARLTTTGGYGRGTATYRGQ